MAMERLVAVIVIARVIVPIDDWLDLSGGWYPYRCGRLPWLLYAGVV